MVTVQQVLDRYAAGLSEQDFAAALDADLTGRAPSGTVMLTGTERAFLTERGIDPADLAPVDPASSVRHTADELVELAGASIVVTDAARRLGVDASRVRHRVADGSLYAFRLGRELRLPLWQFAGAVGATASAPLPHLRAVLAAAPQGVAPVELAAFMTSPQPELALGDTPVSPQDWLRAGGDPAPVCEILAGLYQW